MKKNCVRCNKEYEVSQFHFDDGYCCNCTPKFFSLPQVTTPAMTRHLLSWAIVINLLIMFFGGMLLDGGTISNPLAFFTSCTVLYLLGRMACGKITKHEPPVLTRLQQFALLLLPFYGFPLFFICWMLIRKTFFND